MFIRDAKRSRRWFPERGCILEHQIFSFGKMILRDRCSTSYDLASLFRGRRNTLDTWSGKIAKRIGTRLSALHSTFHFWRKSRRILPFLMLSTSKNEEVSQNCFVFDGEWWQCVSGCGSTLIRWVAEKVTTLQGWYAVTLLFRCYPDTLIRWYADMLVRWYAVTLLRWYAVTLVRWYAVTLIRW